VVTFAEVLEAELQSANEPPSAPQRRAPTFADVLGALPVVRSARRPAWAVELDVELPCNAQAVRRAFRRRALETHPDRPGGSHDAFLRAAQALDEGLFATG
jgi:hypothetical protein